LAVPFPIFKTEGVAPAQAHTNLPNETFEREKGREGFSDTVTHFYHRRPPMMWTEIDGPAHPRLFDTRKYQARSASPWDALLTFHNAHARFRLWRVDQNMSHLVRNADGDDLLFVHEGAGSLFCEYGHMAFTAGDYIVMPRGTSWRIEVSQPAMILMLEATGDSFRLPDRGLMGINAIFDPGVLQSPRIDDKFQAQSDAPTKLALKRRGALTTVQYPFNPLDAVGWKGNVMPLKLNWRDIRPVMSERYHMPPSSHAVFVASRVVVGTFAPRPMESSPDALKLSFFHDNDDYEEVGFLHHGEFMSKDDVAAGSMFYHPCGVTHGPHPGAYGIAEESKRKYADEVLFFFETRDPLDLAQLPDGIENTNYVNSWKGWFDKVKVPSVR
jgi:homogentisate 1,2-dioxygenase